VKIVRVENRTAIVPGFPVGNSFLLDLPPGYGIQLLQLAVTDLPFVDLAVPESVLPFAINRQEYSGLASYDMGQPTRGTQRIELGAGKVFVWPDGLKSRRLFIAATDRVFSTREGIRNRTLCIGVCEDPFLRDAMLDSPAGFGHGADQPVDLWSPADDLTGNAATEPLYVGDCDGFELQLKTTGAGAGAATGQFQLEVSKILNFGAPDWQVNSTFVAPLVAGADLDELWQVTKATGPWVRMGYVWTAGAGARAAQVRLFKGKGKQ
jgi:hypothetical protein